MKTSSIPFWFSLIVAAPMFAQITITTADMENIYGPGKVHTSVNADDVEAVYMMNVGIASSSVQSWTLPANLYKDTLKLTNAAPTSTPYASMFPLATRAQAAAVVTNEGSMEVYIYVRIANDSLIYMGSVFRLKSGALDTTMIDLHPQFGAKMPISLGSILSFRDSLYNGPGDYEIRKTIETFDAFGAITLPVGSVQALRSKRVEINEVHHVGPTITADTVVHINWITKEGHQVSAEVNNNSQTSGNIQVNSIYYTWVASAPVGVQGQHTGSPNGFLLEQNYPNPFNPSTMISYHLPVNSNVSLRIFDMLGREITTLVNEEQSAGWKEVRWNTSGVSSGMYFYQIEAGSFIETKQMLLMR